MSVILVTGGSGALGTHVVARLRARGHEVRVLSRRPDRGTHVGDLTTGAGVAEAAAGAELIVHAASDFRRFGNQDPEHTRTLLGAAGDARHLLYMSIVGIDGIPMRYYRRKLECEGLVSRGGVPYTILRATQFHELVATMLNGVARLPIAPLPLDFRFQPVATGDVATRIADLIEREPAGRADDFGGPEVYTLARLAEIWRDLHGRPRHTVRVPLPGRVARAFREGVNTCPEHADGTGTFAEFAARWQQDPSAR